MKPIHPLALFRLSVLGPLASRGQLAHGELKAITHELAGKIYAIPGERRVHLSEQTIRRWYYVWQKNGIEGLNPCRRHDKGRSHLSLEVQAALTQAKEDNPARSINTLIKMLKSQGIVSKNELSRASVHRFLQQKEMSKRIPANHQTIERRSFVA